MAEEQVIEHVAQGFEEAARATRRINVHNVSLVFGGLAVGAAIGFYFGYRFNREKIRAEEFQRSEREIAEMRAVYQAREARHEAKRTREAREASMPEKPAVDDLVKEKGYTSYSRTDAPIEERPLPSPVPGVVTPSPSDKPSIDSREKINKIREAYLARRLSEGGDKDKNEGWVYAQELTQRSSTRPYIIHEDEFSQCESGYQQVTYTYYAMDDVLTDEEDTILNNRENLIGANTLRWGHGASDINLVHIRNPVLEIEFEICRMPQSFEAEVLGLQDEEPS